MAPARSLRIGSALACAVFSGLTAAAVILDRDGWGALASWLAALWTATLSVPGDRAATRLSKADGIPLLGVTLLALALRGFRSMTTTPFSTPSIRWWRSQSNPGPETRIPSVRRPTSR